MVVQNCWLLYRQFKDYDQTVLDLFGFRREIVEVVLAKYKTPRSSSGRPRGRILPAKRRVSADVRFDHIDHYQIQANTQKRCALCSKNTRKECKKCKVGLHDSCMKEWHNY